MHRKSENFAVVLFRLRLKRKRTKYFIRETMEELLLIIPNTVSSI
jgi:hypothetical protein